MDSIKVAVDSLVEQVAPMVVDTVATNQVVEGVDAVYSAWQTGGIATAVLVVLYAGYKLYKAHFAKK